MQNIFLPFFSSDSSLLMSESCELSGDTGILDFGGIFQQAVPERKDFKTKKREI